MNRLVLPCTPQLLSLTACSESGTLNEIQKVKIDLYLEDKEGLDEEKTNQQLEPGGKKPQLSSSGVWGGFERVGEMRSAAML